MNKTASLFVGALTIGAALSMTSCSDDARFIGSWTALSPIDVAVSMPDVTRATSLVTIDFLQNEHKNGGPVTISGKLDVVKSMAIDSATTCRMNVPATATVNGTWTYDVDDDDDLLLSLDMSTLKVSVDENAITCPGLPAGVQPDSIKAIVAKACEHELTDAAYTDFSRFAVIDDVEVDKSGNKMSFEIHSPETEIYFIKAE